MSPSRPHRTVHTHVVAAPPEVVYELVADVRRWPVIFEPTVHVRHLERTPGVERFELWAQVNGRVNTWASRRDLDPAGLRVTFRQERSQAPLTSMGGDWTFRPVSGGRTEVVLTHRFTVDGGEEQLAWMNQALDTNSARELAALARVAELGHPVDDLVFSFTDRVVLPGVSAADVYAFVRRSDLWPQRLPHVGRVSLSEPQPDVQDMEMDTVTAEGRSHTTRSIRLCLPGQIVYKQVVPPGMLLGHAGSWEFADGPGGAEVQARHSVAVDPAAIDAVLGAGSTPADARRHLRDVLGRNSRATLEHAGRYAREQPAPHTGAGVSR
ncbi:aromatase/cyclase [Micromonospora sp. CPCC 206171]|uniref:aromatase/cyclase n=1 Tax=Micromonospora sp. CPCC 206171 TaxID=3122405 RepID=UPI002FEFCD76